MKYFRQTAEAYFIFLYVQVRLSDSRLRHHTGQTLPALGGDWGCCTDPIAHVLDKKNNKWNFLVHTHFWLVCLYLMKKKNVKTKNASVTGYCIYNQLQMYIKLLHIILTAF